MDPFVALMRRYVVDYTNSHDLAVCDEIMEPDYVLSMGPHVLSGRDEAYKPATRRQLEQFPGLGLTVHDVVSNGERLALVFSEHGASVRHGGAVAAWRGIGLYSWNGVRLTANRVEQDYLARRRQLADGVPDAVPPPAPAPWDTATGEPDAGVEAVAAAWAEQGAPPVGDVVLDEGRDDGRDDGRDEGRDEGRDAGGLVDVAEVVIDDLFSAGDRAAVHVTVHGSYRGGLERHGFAGLDEHVGAPATLHAAAVVTVADGRVVAGRVVRDRLGLARALAASPAGTPT